MVVGLECAALALHDGRKECAVDGWGENELEVSATESHWSEEEGRTSSEASVVDLLGRTSTIISFLQAMRICTGHGYLLPCLRQSRGKLGCCV
jgi:hypothetical protein